MKRKLVLISLITILAASLAGCILSTSPAKNSTVTLKVGESKTFKVTGSLNGQYRWYKDTRLVSVSTASSYTYTAVNGDVGKFTLMVQTVDSMTNQTLAVSWTVEVIRNLPPVAEAGNDQNILLGTTVQLDGSLSSDPEDMPLTYTWYFTAKPAGSTVSLSDPTAARPTFKPDIAGGYTLILFVSDGEKSASDTVTITAYLSNFPPSANAGPDQTVLLGSTVNLDGSLSSDPENEPLSYAWSIISKPDGSIAQISDPSGKTPSFTPDRKGHYVIGLTVSDGVLTSGQDTMDIYVFNNAPVADAGTDMTIPFGGTATLDGSLSNDPDGTPVTYLWLIISKPAGSLAALSNDTAAKPSFTPDRKGSYVFKLIVSDGDLSGEDTVTLTSSNNVPVAEAGSDITISLGTTVHMNGNLSHDPDGDTLTYSWSIISRPAGSTALISNPAIINPQFTPDKKGRYTVQLIVSDGELVSAPDTFIISITNHAPTVEAGDDQSIAFPDFTAQLNGSGTDLDGDPLAYSWTILSRPEGSSAVLSNPAIANPTFLPDMKGEYVFQLIVNDGEDDSVADTVKLVVYNNAPTAEAGDNIDLFFTGGGQAVQLSGSGMDTEGSPLTVSWSIVSAPYGSSAALSNPAILNPTFTPDVIGVYVFRMIVSDGDLSGEDTVMLTVYNNLPVASAGPDQNSIYLGTTAQLDGSASYDPESQPLNFVWTITSAPAGSAAVLSNRYVMKPTFTPDMKGTYVIQLVVDDGVQYSSPDSMSITVPNRAPYAWAGNDQTINKGVTASLSGTASDPDGDSLSYMWSVFSAPSGSTAVISNPESLNGATFKPDKGGVYTIQLQVYDGTTYTIDTMILTRQANFAPTAEAGANQTAIRYANRTVQLNGSGSSDLDNDPLTYSWSVTSSPSGSSAVLSSTTVVNPTITLDLPGTYVISLTVNDGETNSAADTVSLTTSQATYTTGFEGGSLNDSGGNAWTPTSYGIMGPVGAYDAEAHTGSYSYRMKDCNNFLGDCGSGWHKLTNYTGRFVISVSYWAVTPTYDKFPNLAAGLYEGATQRVAYTGVNFYTQYSWAPNRVVTDINFLLNGNGGGAWLPHAMWFDDISVTLWN
ncbi:MAG TPA: PKD domain-containing protein [Desulfomonilia bacterium]